MTSQTILLVGNPNSGKTTLFNALTGLRQRVGNWAGVTVEVKTGDFELGPGLRKRQAYTLVDLPGLYTLSATGAKDAALAAHVIATHPASFILNVIDASNLERSLLLTSELLSRKLPVIVVLNMIDLASKRGLSIDTQQLARALQCPVITSASRDSIQQAMDQLTSTNSVFDPDLSLAMRYQKIRQMIASVVTHHAPKTRTLSDSLDAIALHRFFGLPIFLAVMYGLFFFTMQGNRLLQPYFDAGSRFLFIDGLSTLSAKWHLTNHWLFLLVSGFGRGLNTICTLLPVIGVLFFLLTLLEESGYMARAAFVIDRLMASLGLPGKAFIPMIIGFGCNVPAVLSARTLEYEKDRLLTILMAPFMSCSARLTIYAMFAAAFFPAHGYNVIFALYVIGIFMALLTGLIIRKTYLKGPPSPLVMILPHYNLPAWATLWRAVWYRLYDFAWRVGRMVVPVCLIVDLLGRDGGAVLAAFGKGLAPLFAPLGLTPDNWPAIVGLLTGVLAKEVVLGTLNTLYASLAATPGLAMTALLKMNFKSAAAVFSYLLFVLLYFPCVSTMGAMFREMHRRWVFFSMSWMLLVAYGTAVFFYQTATIGAHPLSSSLWILGIALSFVGAILGLRALAARDFLFKMRHITPSLCVARCFKCPVRAFKK